MRTQMAGGKAAMEPTDPQQALRGMPELAVVLNFLHTFRAHLHLTGFTAVRHGHHGAPRSARESERTDRQRPTGPNGVVPLVETPTAHRSLSAGTSPASRFAAFEQATLIISCCPQRHGRRLHSSGVRSRGVLLFEVAIQRHDGC